MNWKQPRKRNFILRYYLSFSYCYATNAFNMKCIKTILLINGTERRPRMCLDTNTFIELKICFRQYHIAYWFIPRFIAVFHFSSCVAGECEYMNAKYFWRVYFTWYTALVVSALQVPHIGLIEFLFAQSINSYQVCDSYKKWYILCDINSNFEIANWPSQKCQIGWNKCKKRDHWNTYYFLLSYMNTLTTVVNFYVIVKVISYFEGKV